MALIEKLNTLIAKLEEAKADLEKVDAGKVGQPGTRFRKESKAVQDGLKQIGKDILELRKK